MPKITIRPGNISEPTQGTVVFDNSVLRNLLVQKQPAALDWLATRAAPVDVANISIDDHGRVVIADKNFAKIIAERVAKHSEGVGAELSDTVCSNGSC